MTQREDGGPAFPTPTERWSDDEKRVERAFTEDGMSLRDYFAGQALAGMLAAPCDMKRVRLLMESRNADAARAMVAYEHADAMLAARSA